MSKSANILRNLATRIDRQARYAKERRLEQRSIRNDDILVGIAKALRAAADEEAGTCCPSSYVTTFCGLTADEVLDLKAAVDRAQHETEGYKRQYSFDKKRIADLGQQIDRLLADANERQVALDQRYHEIANLRHQLTKAKERGDRYKRQYHLVAYGKLPQSERYYGPVVPDLSFLAPLVAAIEANTKKYDCCRNAAVKADTTHCDFTGRRVGLWLHCGGYVEAILP